MSKMVIYPLNKINLKSLLDYYFPFLASGNFSELISDFRSNTLTLNDLEFAAQKILPFIHLIQTRLTEHLTQANAIDYAVEIFLYDCINYSDLAPERAEIIKLIRSESRIDETYEEMLNRQNRLFLNHSWN